MFLSWAELSQLGAAYAAKTQGFLGEPTSGIALQNAVGDGRWGFSFRVNHQEISACSELLTRLDPNISSATLKKLGSHDWFTMSECLSMAVLRELGVIYDAHVEVLPFGGGLWFFNSKQTSDTRATKEAVREGLFYAHDLDKVSAIFVLSDALEISLDQALALVDEALSNSTQMSFAVYELQSSNVFSINWCGRDNPHFTISQS